jgi:hypothetical protein
MFLLYSIKTIVSTLSELSRDLTPERENFSWNIEWVSVFGKEQEEFNKINRKVPQINFNICQKLTGSEVLFDKLKWN